MNTLMEYQSKEILKTQTSRNQACMPSNAAYYNNFFIVKIVILKFKLIPANTASNNAMT